MEQPTEQPTNIDFIETLLTSFESRIQKIETVFTTSDAVTEFSHTLMNDFQLSMKELKKERTQLNDLLRGNMAKSGSLRKNDYNILMDDIFILLDEKENEAESHFNLYIEDQKAMIRFLRQGILDIKNTENNNNTEKITAFKLHLETILKNQQHRKEGAINKFVDFQNIHKKLTTNFQLLLNRDVHIFCKDIKNIKKQLLEEFV